MKAAIKFMWKPTLIGGLIGTIMVMSIVSTAMHRAEAAEETSSTNFQFEVIHQGEVEVIKNVETGILFLRSGGSGGDMTQWIDSQGRAMTMERYIKAAGK
jgi:hypothetical protein